MTVYLILVLLWTAYRAFEAYVFERPQSRPYWVGFLISELVLAPFSFVLELMPGGTLHERIRDAYTAARRRNEAFEESGKPKLIG
jgi:hypothetical protein